MPSSAALAGLFSSTHFPGDAERSAVGPKRAGDDLDERRFARAVLAHQGVDFPRQ